MALQIKKFLLKSSNLIIIRVDEKKVIYDQRFEPLVDIQPNCIALLMAIDELGKCSEIFHNKFYSFSLDFDKNFNIFFLKKILDFF